MPECSDSVAGRTTKQMKVEAAMVSQDSQHVGMTVGMGCRRDAVKLAYLEHLDLAAGRVQVLRVLPVLVLLKGVNLHSERHALFTPVLPRGELCADTMYL